MVYGNKILTGYQTLEPPSTSMMPFMGPLSHNSIDILKLTALKGSMGFSKELDELKKTHGQCQARLGQLESRAGSEFDRQEISRLQGAVSAIEGVWKKKVGDLQESYTRDVKMYEERLTKLRDQHETGHVDHELQKKMGGLTEELENLRKKTKQADGKSIQQVRESYEERIRVMQERIDRMSRNREGVGGGDDSSKIRDCRRDIERLENLVKTLSDSSELAKRLAAYEEAGFVLPLFDTKTEQGVIVLQDVQKRLAMWTMLGDDAHAKVMVRKKILEKEKEDEANDPGVTERRTEEKKTQDEVRMSAMSEQDRKVYDNKLLQEESEKAIIGGLDDIRNTLKAFTEDHKQDKNWITKHLEGVMVSTDENMNMSDFYKKKISLDYMVDLQEKSDIFRKVFTLYDRYVPLDIGSIDIHDPGSLKAMAVYAREMLKRNPSIPVGDLFGVFRELKSAKTERRYFMQVLNAMFEGSRGESSQAPRGSAQVKTQLDNILAQSVNYVLLLALLSEDMDPKVISVQLKSHRDAMGGIYTKYIKALLEDTLEMKYPDPTMDYVFKTSQTKASGNPIHQGDTNPFDVLAEEKSGHINNMVTSTIGYNTGLPILEPTVEKYRNKYEQRKKEYDEKIDMVPPSSPFRVFGVFDASDSEQEELRIQAGYYVLSESITLRMSLLNGSMKTIRNIFKDLDQLGTVEVLPGKKKNASILLKGAKKAMELVPKHLEISQLPLSDMENEYAEAMEVYTKENVASYSTEVREKWDKMLKFIRDAWCCIEYFNIEQLFLNEIRKDTPPPPTMSSIISSIAHRYNPGRPESVKLCSDATTIFSGRDLIGQTFDLEITENLITKIEAVKSGRAKNRKFSDAQIDHMIFKDGVRPPEYRKGIPAPPPLPGLPPPPPPLPGPTARRVSNSVEGGSRVPESSGPADMGGMLAEMMAASRRRSNRLQNAPPPPPRSPGSVTARRVSNSVESNSISGGVPSVGGPADMGGMFAEMVAASRRRSNRLQDAHQ